jgi:hypothetical protein
MTKTECSQSSTKVVVVSSRKEIKKTPLLVGLTCRNGLFESKEEEEELICR